MFLKSGQNNYTKYIFYSQYNKGREYSEKSHLNLQTSQPHTRADDTETPHTKDIDNKTLINN